MLTLIGGVSLGRTRRHRSRRSLLIGLGLLVMAATGLFASIATPLADALARSTFATWTTVGGCAFGALLLLAATLLPERAVPHGRGAVALALAAGGAGAAVRWGSRGRSGRRPPAIPSAARRGRASCASTSLRSSPPVPPTASRSGTPRSTAPVPSTASTAARRGRARPCSWFVQQALSAIFRSTIGVPSIASSASTRRSVGSRARRR